jgi:hypothetical protein
MGTAHMKENRMNRLVSLSLVFSLGACSSDFEESRSNEAVSVESSLAPSRTLFMTVEQVHLLTEFAVPVLQLDGPSSTTAPLIRVYMTSEVDRTSVEGYLDSSRMAYVVTSDAQLGSVFDVMWYKLNVSLGVLDDRVVRIDFVASLR